MTWITEERTAKTIGALRIVYCRPKEGTEGAHQVEFPDGRAVRVVPDGQTTGKRRSTTILAACRAIAEVAYPVKLDPYSYLIGVLTDNKLAWEAVDLTAMSIEEWLSEWLGGYLGVERSAVLADALIEDLAADGWQIVQASR